MNYQYLKHPGYTDSNEAIAVLFSASVASFLSAKITELSKEFYPPGIIVPCERIVDVLNDVYEAYRPSTGDIYTRYAIPSAENPNCVDEIINQTIRIVMDAVKNQLTTDRTNGQLTQWTTVLGDFNREGLRSHDVIKIKRRRTAPFQFNMVY